MLEEGLLLRADGETCRCLEAPRPPGAGGRAGRDFSLYKKQTVCRRIERRRVIHQVDGIASYARYLQENLQELDLLSRELLIGETGFFRDPAAGDVLRDKALPSLFSQVPAGGALRAWCAGSSTGEEAIARPDVATGQRACRLALIDIAEPRRLRDDLLESEERYRVIVESSRDLIFFLDSNGGLRWCNQPARALVGGAAPDEDLMRRVHPADAPRVADAWGATRRWWSWPRRSGSWPTRPSRC